MFENIIPHRINWKHTHLRRYMPMVVNRWRIGWDPVEVVPLSSANISSISSSDNDGTLLYWCLKIRIRILRLHHFIPKRFYFPLNQNKNAFQ